MQRKIIANIDKKKGPVIAVGMADFDSRNDMSVAEIFDRADHLMYEDKEWLKSR